MNRLIVFLISFCCLFSAKAQPNDFSTNVSKPKSEYIPVTRFWREHNIFQHLDASLTLGTTGIGLDVSSPITDMFQLRAGFSFMPRFNRTMNFGVQVGDNPSQSAAKFETLSSFMQNTMGYKIDNSVDMIGEPTYYNFSLLFDVFPFRQNKNWHFTAGFYWGPSKFAEAVNSTESMNTLISLAIYNNLYDKSDIHINGDAEGNHPPQYILQVPDPDDPDGKMMPVSLDPQIEQRFLSFGRMGFHLGDYARDIYDANGNLLHAKGDRYVMEADANNMVIVHAKSNSFKPYLGFGYGGRLLKNRDDWKVSFDAGVLFWGGKPDLYLHDGTNLSEDLTNISGQVADYVDLSKKFIVYPTLSVRLTKTIF